MAQSSQVVVENTGESYVCPADVILLDAALAAGLHMPHNCRGGACGTCKAQILDGEVDHGWVMSFAISDEEKAQGFCLACQSKPLSPSLRLKMVNPMEARGANEETIAPAEFSVDVLAAQKATPSVLRLVVALPRTAHFRFRAGMNMEFILPDLDQPRPYSMANAPGADGMAPGGQLEFFITRHPEGRASGWLHAHARPGISLAIRGPYGEFHLPRNADAPILALAGGTGLSPILSLLTGELRAGLSAPIDLMFSVRDRGEAFALERLAALERRHANLRYRITLTRENAAPDGWSVGRVPTLLATENRDLWRHIVLVAGAPSFVDDCADAAKRLGAPADRVHVDSFLPRAPGARPDFG